MRRKWFMLDLDTLRNEGMKEVMKEDAVCMAIATQTDKNQNQSIAIHTYIRTYFTYILEVLLLKY